MRSRSGIVILAALVVAGGGVAGVSSAQAPPPTAADWSGTIAVDFVDERIRKADLTASAASLAPATSIDEGLSSVNRRVWLRLKFNPPLPPPGQAASGKGATVVVCWSGTAKWVGPQADHAHTPAAGESHWENDYNAFPAGGHKPFEQHDFLQQKLVAYPPLGPVRQMPGCTVATLRHEPTGLIFQRRAWEPSNSATDVDADGNLVAALVHVTNIVDDDRWERDETITATVMPRDVARLSGCEDPSKPSPSTRLNLLDCGDGVAPLGVYDAPSATLTIVDDDSPCGGGLSVDNPCYYNAIPPDRGVWRRNPNGPSMPSDPDLVDVSHSGVNGATHVNTVPGFREVDLGELVLQPVRGDTDGHAYVVRNPQQPAPGQTLTVRMRTDYVDSPAGSVTVQPDQLDFTAADWDQPRIVRVIASADAEPGDSFVIRHRFSTGFSDPYIKAYEGQREWYSYQERSTDEADCFNARNQELRKNGPEKSTRWTAPCVITRRGSRQASIPRFDVAGHVPYATETPFASDDQLTTPVLDNDLPAQQQQDQQQPETPETEQPDAETEEPEAETETACASTDTALINQIAAKIQRHRTTGRSDLVETFGRAHATMLGNDSYTVTDIKTRPDRQAPNWQGNGPNALWQAVYTELDRLQTCRNN
ncbi:MAG: hypothetical protein OXF75_12800 [Acidimicrobiaceae bacterium]|nr:hypothetical protein [Acidimicrobiaceae bacterium]